MTDPYPPSAGDLAAPQPEAPLLTIGDITVTRNWIVVPQGHFPLRGTTWTVQDSTVATEGIPIYAIVLTIVFVWFCLLGLLFLLIKEQKYTGFVAVAVTGEGFYHNVHLPPGPATSAWVAGAVAQARGLATNAA